MKRKQQGKMKLLLRIGRPAPGAFCVCAMRALYSTCSVCCICAAWCCCTCCCRCCSCCWPWLSCTLLLARGTGTGREVCCVCAFPSRARKVASSWVEGPVLSFSSAALTSCSLATWSWRGIKPNSSLLDQHELVRKNQNNSKNLH